MIKKMLLLAAILLQLGLVSVGTVQANDPPEPTCMPCAL